MVQNKRMWVLAAVLAAGLVGTVRADEVSELRKQVENQYNELLKVQTKLLEIEAAQAKQGASVKKLETTGPALPEALKWVEKVKLYGDFRYRYEYIDDDARSSDQHRNRIRARIGLEAKVNDEMSYNFRVASGSEDPVSTNQTLDGGFSSKDIWLDLAYLKWQPESMKDWSFLFGKTINPFYRPGENQLIWDDDLNPEGIAVQYAAELSDTLGLFANGGGMWVEESSSNADVSLWGLQAGLKHKLNENNSFTWGGSYYKYGNVKDEETFYDVTDGFGNTTYADGDSAFYMYDYELAEAFAEYGTKIGNTPASIYGDYVVNTASGVSDDTGWLVGAKLGKAKDPGTWEAGYEYRDLENDAVVGVFTDSDFIGGGNGGKGHKFGVSYAIAKNATIGATYFMSERYVAGGDDENYDRFQFDIKVKF